MSGGTGAERLTTERSSRTWSSLASRTESRHLLLGGAGAVLGALVGLLALSGTTPLAGEDSIGQVAALAVLASALNSQDPYWWERYFSELGEGGDLASLTFNLTLLLTGIALVTVSEFLAHDLDLWARRAGEPGWVITGVRTMLSAVGVLVALIAVVSRTVSVFWHNVVAMALVVVFGLTLLAIPVLLRRLPGGLLALTAAAFGLLVAVIVLYAGLD